MCPHPPSQSIRESASQIICDLAANPANFMSWIMRSLSSDIVIPFPQKAKWKTPATPAGNPNVSRVSTCDPRSVAKRQGAMVPHPDWGVLPVESAKQRRLTRRIDNPLHSQQVNNANHRQLFAPRGAAASSKDSEDTDLARQSG